MNANERIRSMPNDEPDLSPEEHDAWFRAEVQRAMDDLRPGIPHEEVMKQMREAIQSTKARNSVPNHDPAQG
jgi:hypothetical protein